MSRCTLAAGGFTIGLDLGDRSHYVCVLDVAGEILHEGPLLNDSAAMFVPSPGDALGDGDDAARRPYRLRRLNNIIHHEPMNPPGPPFRGLVQPLARA